MMLIKFHSFCTFDGIRIGLSTENALLDLYGDDTRLLRRFFDFANIFKDVWSGHAEMMQKNVFNLFIKARFSFVQVWTEQLMDFPLNSMTPALSKASKRFWVKIVNKSTVVSIYKKIHNSKVNTTAVAMSR